MRKFAGEFRNLQQIMKKTTYALCMMIAVGMGLTSCLKNDADDAETISYNETAISSFALSAVNRYIHTTTSAGKDSVYRQVLTVKNYPFTIDQYQRKIYNTDSLPADCDLKHVLATIGKSTYSGNIYIKSMVSDTLFVYNSSDSLDLSQTREIRVYDNTLTRYRSYTLQVNKKSDSSTGSTFIWEQMRSHLDRRDHWCRGRRRLPADRHRGLRELPLGSPAPYGIPPDGRPIQPERLYVQRMAQGDH